LRELLAPSYVMFSSAIDPTNTLISRDGRTTVDRSRQPRSQRLKMYAITSAALWAED